jgi:hypothetical protein
LGLKVLAAVASGLDCVIEPLTAILFSAVWLHIISGCTQAEKVNRRQLAIKARLGRS